MSKLALVTGASSGIGKATAILLAQNGWQVIAIARRKEILAALAHEVGEAIVPIACDGGDGEAVLRIADQIKNEHGIPDVIIHCAGAGKWKELEDTTPDELNRMLDAPFRSAFHFNHAFIAPMIERGSGRLLHVNSPAGLFPWAGATGYAATRFALRGLNEALYMDLYGTGVSTCNVFFGEVSSAYFDANPDSHHKLPGIASWVPTKPPEYCAAVLLGAIDSRKREIAAPFMLKTFLWSHQLFPGLVRYLIAKTQRKR